MAHPNIGIFVLPSDVIGHAQSFLPPSCRTKMVSRGWLQNGLRNGASTRRKWRDRQRLFIFMRTFGSAFVGLSWQGFCLKMMRVTKRARSPTAGHLTWEAAAHRRMMYQRCRACGAYTRAYVHGTIHLCRCCRRNQGLKYAHMVTKEEALARGASMGAIEETPYHVDSMRHFRFWNDIIKPRG